MASWVQEIYLTGNVYIDGNVSISGNISGGGASSNVSVPGNLDGITAPVTVYGDVGVTGNVGNVTRPVLVEGNVDVAAGNGVVTISGNVAGVTAPVGVTGSFTTVTGNVASVSAAIGVSAVSATVGVYGTLGNVGNLSGITNPVTISSFVSPLSVTGTIGNVVGNVRGITAPVTTRGNLSVAGNIAGFASQIVVSNVTSATVVRGAVSNVAGNVPTFTAPWTVSGNATIQMTETATSVFGNVPGVTNPVTAEGNILSIATLGGVTSQISVSSVYSAVRLAGNLGNVSGSFFGITRPVTVYGSVSATIGNGYQAVLGNVPGVTLPATIGGGAVGNLVGNVAGITASVTTTGNLTSIVGNVFGITSPIGVSSVAASNTAVYGDVGISGNVLGVASNVAVVASALNFSGNLAGITANVVVFGNLSFGSGGSVTYASNALGISNTSDVYLDGANDPFDRMRIASPVHVLTCQVMNGDPDLVFSRRVLGAGNVTYVLNYGCYRLNVATTSGTAGLESRIRGVCPQGATMVSRQVFKFASNNASAGVSQRVGYFDDSDGHFLLLNAGNVSFATRSSATGAVVETQYPQSSWNVNKMNGTGYLGANVNFLTQQVLVTSFGVGAGVLKFGFVVGGSVMVAHTVSSTGSFPFPLAANSTLPLRWDVQATNGSADYMYAISGSLIAEGAPRDELPGVDRSCTIRSLANIPTRASAAAGEMVAIRLGNAFTRYGTAYLKSINLAMPSISGISNVAYSWYLCLNAGVSNTVTWSPVQNSIVSVAAGGRSIANTGTVLASGSAFMQLGSNDQAAGGLVDLKFDRTLDKYLGNDDVLSIVCYGATTSFSTAMTAFATMRWRECY